MRFRDMTDRRAAVWLSTSTLLWESVVENHQRNGSRFLLPAFVATCAAGVIAALIGAL